MAGGDVAEGVYPNVAVVFGGFAVAVATVVDEHGGAESVDDNGAVAQSKEVGNWVVFVEVVGFFFADVAAGVLGDARSFADGRGGVAAGGVNGRGANDESHERLAMIELPYSVGAGCGVFERNASRGIVSPADAVPRGIKRRERA